MSPGILLVVIVAGAYLAAHVASEWLARRHLIVSGAEYLLLGALLGPEVSGLLQASVVDGFAPFLTLAFGWVGALVGAQFYIRDMARLPAAPFLLALTQALLVGSAVGGAMAGVLVWGLGVGAGSAVAPALALGAIAVSSAPAGIALVAHRLQSRGALLRQLHVATGVDALLAILALGLLLPAASGLAATAIGLVGGALFHLFLGRERNIDRLFIALAGALILASGAAAYLRLSPLLPALLIGFVLVNTSPSRHEIRKVLGRVERPLYFTLLIFAGAAWEFDAPGRLLTAVAYVTLRIAAKVGGGALAARMHGALPVLGRRWGWGLVGHGGLAVALALNFRMVDATPLAGTVFTAVLVSVLVTDSLSARVVGAVLATAPSSRRMSGRGGEGAP